MELNARRLVHFAHPTSISPSVGRRTDIHDYAGDEKEELWGDPHDSRFEAGTRQPPVSCT